MKSENCILFIINPVSGNLDKGEILALITAEAEKKNYNFKVYKTTGTGDKEAIESLITQYNPSRVIVAGGDGTVTLVASCVYKTDIVLGIIPAGSANGMATNFELPQTLDKQIEIAFSNNTLTIDVLLINNTICLHIADLGINAELIKNYENSGIRGKLGYFIQSIPTLFQSDFPFHFTIKTPTAQYSETGVLLAIANANKFGTGATINPTGKLNDGKFEVLIFKNLDIIEIFKTMQDNPNMSSNFVKIIPTASAEISCLNKIPFQIDGEFLGEKDTLSVKMSKHKLHIALPQKFCKLHSR